MTGTVTDSKGKAGRRCHRARHRDALAEAGRSLARADGRARRVRDPRRRTRRRIAWWPRSPDLAPGILESVAVERDVRGPRRRRPARRSRSCAAACVGARRQADARLASSFGSSPASRCPTRSRAQLVAEAADDGVFQPAHRSRIRTSWRRAAPASPRAASTSTCRAGSETVDLGDVVLEVGIAIRGRVRDAAGRPVEGATLVTYSQETDRSFEARSRGGRHLHAGRPAPRPLLDLRLRDRDGTRAAEGGGGRDRHRLRPAAAGAPSSGAVVDEAGRPVEAFRVMARPPMRIGHDEQRPHGFVRRSPTAGSCSRTWPRANTSST